VAPGRGGRPWRLARIGRTATLKAGSRPIAAHLESLTQPESADLTMTTIKQIRDELRRSFSGRAWHGPALLEALADVTAAEATARPVAGAHSIAELLLHCLAWTEEVTHRVRGADAGYPERGDWPAVPDLTGEGWSALRQELEGAAAALDLAISEQPPERLGERVGGPDHDPPLGSGVRIESMLHGLAHHNAYHGGQILILKRALRPQP
jgi:uncharacterized damage-inducible protein DinB